MSEEARPSWDHYFAQIAQAAARRATCNRKHVGAVIVRDRMILATGYNGSPRGTAHCSGPEGEGHQMAEMLGRMSCVRTLHAEENAIIQAARHGVALLSATVYTTASPCYDCAKRIINAGIAEVVYGAQYDSRYGMSADPVARLFAEAGVTYRQLEV